MRKRIGVALTIFALNFFFLNSAGAAVVVSSWSHALIARDSVGDQAQSEELVATLPFLKSNSVLTNGGTSGSAVYDFSATGDSASFGFDLELFRTGTIDSQANAAGDIFFTVTTPSLVNIDGFFSLVGGGRISGGAEVRDLTVSGGPSGFIYRSIQRSLTTPNQFCSIGGLDGDTANFLNGSLPGPLTTPGHQYLLSYNFDIITPADGDEGASATSAINFNIQAGTVPGPTPMPEPTTLALFGLGLAGLGFARRRKKLAA